MQAAAALIGALWTLAACYSLGSAIAAVLGLRLSRLETFPFALVLGGSVFHLLVFTVLALKIAYTPVLVFVLLAALGSGIAKGSWRLPSGNADAVDQSEKQPPPYLRYLLGVVVVVYFILYFSNAWAPEFSPDGATYHLGLVARYLRVHGFEAVPTNVYSSLSGGLEMLFVTAFAIGRHSAAALVHFGFMIALGMAVMAYGYRIGKPSVGACAALLVCLSPVVGVDGTSAYVDLAAAAAAFIVFYLVQMWDERRDTGLLIAIGLVGGYCYAVKYTMAVMLVYAVACVWWSGRRARPVLVVLACASVMILPWMAKDWIYWQNPVAPFANTIFRNPFIHPEFERSWSEDLRHYNLPSLWRLPLEVTIRGVLLGGLLGPVFLAAPLALIALRWRQGRILLAPAALLLAVYFGNIGARFLIPALPFVSLAMGLALAANRAAPILLLLVIGHAVASWPPVLHSYSHPWALLYIPRKAALRLTSEQDYLSVNPEYQFARMIEAGVPEGARVLAVNTVPDAYTTREVLVAYEGTFNAVLEDILGVAAFDIYRPSRAWVFHFPSRMVRGVRIVQTATMPKAEYQWSVHELRLYSRGAEVARDAQWRLSAFPNPWDVTMAFDNSEATRWRTWETTRPGDSLRVEFAQDEAVDEVRLETSPDNSFVKLRLEVMDSKVGGNVWTPTDVAMEELPMTYEGSLKKAAAYEMHARGVDYLLMRDTDWGGPIFSADPASWGLRIVVRAGAPGVGATLYRLDTPVTPDSRSKP